jgi:hypothetical protein
MYEFFVVMVLFGASAMVFTTGPPTLADQGFELVQT